MGIVEDISRGRTISFSLSWVIADPEFIRYMTELAKPKVIGKVLKIEKDGGVWVGTGPRYLNNARKSMDYKLRRELR
jgi:hypothetical protein